MCNSTEILKCIFSISDTLVGSFLGVIIGAILNNHFVTKSTEKHFFNIASQKFKSELMPFYHEVCEMFGKNAENILGNNDTWSFRRMQQIIPHHSKIINEFLFSIPIKHRHSFNIIADSYCPPQTICSED